ncbi:MAG: hypothetical protein MZV65_29395 [Chromatiales bacterium]|nr:hypothetical protein [Chromatiales bacterium]
MTAIDFPASGLRLGLLGASAIAAATDAADEITVQVIGEQGARGITQQIRPADVNTRATTSEAAREQREALSEQRRQVEEQAREQRSNAAGGGHAPAGVEPQRMTERAPVPTPGRTGAGMPRHAPLAQATREPRTGTALPAG